MTLEIIDNVWINSFKLLISSPFLAVMFYMCTKTGGIDSFWKACLFFVVNLFFKVFSFSIILMQTFGFPFGTFKLAEKGKKNFLLYLMPILYTLLNLAIPLITKIFGIQLIEKVRPLIQIIFDPSQEGIQELGPWFKSSLISLFLPIQNLVSHLPEMNEMTNIIILIVIFLFTVIFVVFLFIFSVKTISKAGDEIQDTNPFYRFYKIITFDSTIKVVWPWQSGWDKKKHTIWPMVILCIVTVGLAFLVYRQKNDIISILNQNIVGANGSILTLLNIVILICLFGSNFYFYIKNYGTCWLDNESPDNNDKYTLGGIILFILYLVVTLSWLRWNKSDDKDTFGEVGYMLMILVVICCFNLNQLWFKHEDCQNNDKPLDRVYYWMKFMFGISGSWSWLIFLLALMFDKLTGLFNQKYSLISLGIIPFINNIFRTIMLFIANFIGFIPYWLGDVNFGKI